VEPSPLTPDDELAVAIGAVIDRTDEGTGRIGRDQVRDVFRLAARSAKAAGTKAVASGQWLAEVTLDVAGHLPVRDLDTLREHHGGRAGALLSGPLIRNASLAAATVGATTGAVAAASTATVAGWATLPAELAAETLLVVAVEMKLVGELHEAAGYPIARDLRRSGPLIARSWVDVRGLAPSDVALLLRPAEGGALAATASNLLGHQARDQLISQIRKRLVGRAGRNTATLLPLLAGAVIGGELNRRATRKLGTTVAGTLGIPPP
jgi:hypothetical protein